MDIVKVRELTDTELGQELATQRRSLYDLRFQLATRQLTDHSQLSRRPSLDRADPDRDDRARPRRERAVAQGRAGTGRPRARARPQPPRASRVARPRSQLRRRPPRAAPEVRNERGCAHHAQGKGRPRRVRQDGQDDRRVRRAPVSGTRCTSASSACRPSSRRTTSATRRASVTRCASSSRARCRRPSAGAWSRSWPAPARVPASRSWPKRPRRARRSTWPPTPAATERLRGRGRAGHGRRRGHRRPLPTDAEEAS